MSYLTWEDMARLLIASDNKLMDIFKNRRAIWKDIFIKNTNIYKPIAIGKHDHFEMKKSPHYNPEWMERYTLPLVNMSSTLRIRPEAIALARDGYELMKQRMSFSGCLVENSPPQLMTITCKPLVDVFPLVAYHPTEPLVAVATDNFTMNIYRMAGPQLYHFGPILFTCRIPYYYLNFSHNSSLEQPGYAILSLTWSPMGSYLMMQIGKMQREHLSACGIQRVMDDTDGAKFSKRIVIIKYDSATQEAVIINGECHFRVDATLASSHLWLNDHEFLLPGHNNTNRLRVASIKEDEIVIKHTSIFDCHTPFVSIKNEIKVLGDTETEEYVNTIGLSYVGAYIAGIK